MQNYAMRIILKKPPRTHSESLRQTLGWTTLKKRRQNNMLCQVHRCLQGHAPQYLCHKFCTNAESGYKGTRGENKLQTAIEVLLNFTLCRSGILVVKLKFQQHVALIVDRVSRQCIHCLEATQTIPRLYRRTNREVRYILIANYLSYCKISHTA